MKYVDLKSKQEALDLYSYEAEENMGVFFRTYSYKDLKVTVCVGINEVFYTDYHTFLYLLEENKYRAVTTLMKRTNEEISRKYFGNQRVKNNGF